MKMVTKDRGVRNGPWLYKHWSASWADDGENLWLCMDRLLDWFDVPDAAKCVRVTVGPKHTHIPAGACPELQ